MSTKTDVTEPAASATPPFPNCRYQICDLPGQCVTEGKCHHPRAASATPRTDGEAYERLGVPMIEVEFSRQLERELAALQAKLDEANAQLLRSDENITYHATDACKARTELGALRSELTAARKRIGQLEEDVARRDLALQSLAQPSAERADHSALVKRILDPRNQFLFDPAVSDEAWKLLREAADALTNAAGRAEQSVQAPSGGQPQEPVPAAPKLSPERVPSGCYVESTIEYCPPSIPAK